MLHTLYGARSMRVWFDLGPYKVTELISPVQLLTTNILNGWPCLMIFTYSIKFAIISIKFSKFDSLLGMKF